MCGLVVQVGSKYQHWDGWVPVEQEGAAAAVWRCFPDGVPRVFYRNGFVMQAVPNDPAEVAFTPSGCLSRACCLAVQ